MKAKDNVLSILSDMSDVQRKVLAKEICKICEKQYRKGYQHGVGDHKDGLVTEKQAGNFRHKGSIQGYEKVVYPPHFKGKCDSFERVSVELAMQGMDLLNYLFNSIT